jgi:signal recognition particle receptor subunit beta
VHRAAPPETRGQIVSLATPVDRTLYFDFLPLRIPQVREHHVRLQLFTVPGQVYFNATRKLVLTGADGVVFVADSQRKRADANQESLENLRANLEEQGRRLDTVPWVIQYNKRDLEGVLPESELQRQLNPSRTPAFDTCATRGDGVLDALDVLVKLVLDDLESRGQLGSERSTSGEVKLHRTDQALEEQIGRASEEIWHSRRVAPPPGGSDAAVAAVPGPAGVPSVGGALRPSQHGISFARESAAPRPGPTFALLFPEHEEDITALEADLAASRFQGVVTRAEEIATRVLEDAGDRAGLVAPFDPALAALLLGVGGERWLAFRRLVGRVHLGGPVAERDALEAYGMLIELRLRMDRLFA